MSKKTKTPVEVFLRDKAKKLKSDFNDVPMWVIDAFNEFLVVSQPTAREKAIELASHYLCDGDLSVEEMVEAIYNHEDENEIIDYVEGVVVWEKVEFSFTCEQFIQEIGYTK